MSFHRSMPADTLTRAAYDRPPVTPRRTSYAFVRDVMEASGRDRWWLDRANRREVQTRRLLAAVVVLMRRRGYTDRDILQATGIRRPDSYAAQADRLLVRRLSDRLRKAGR